jgi:hypothetical protein
MAQKSLNVVRRQCQRLCSHHKRSKVPAKQNLSELVPGGEIQVLGEFVRLEAQGV